MGEALLLAVGALAIVYRRRLAENIFLSRGRPGTEDELRRAEWWAVIVGLGMIGLTLLVLFGVIEWADKPIRVPR
jgi:hypothetical protein